MCLNKKKAFTLIELLVVISVIALLLSIMIPALKRAKEQAKLVVCLSNMKQLGYAFAIYLEANDQRYPYDNDGFINEDGNHVNADFYGWGDGEFSYGGNSAVIFGSTWMPPAKQRALYPYMKDPEAFRCPADKGEELWSGVDGYWKPTTFGAVGCSYRYNYYLWANPLRAGGVAAENGIAGQKESWVKKPARYILLHEPPALRWNYSGGRYFMWHYSRGTTTVMDPSLAQSDFISNITFVDGHAATYDFTETLLNPIDNIYICEPTGDWVWYQPGDEDPTW